LVNEAGEMLNSVQKRLNFQLHSWSSGLTCSIALQNRLNKPKTSFFAVGGCATLQGGLGDKALQECNLSTKPSTDCSECISPGAEAMSRTGCLLFAVPLQAMVKAKNSSNSLGRQAAISTPGLTHKLCYGAQILISAGRSEPCRSIQVSSGLLSLR
jgi:hypothetical protein